MNRASAVIIKTLRQSGEDGVLAEGIEGR